MKAIETTGTVDKQGQLSLDKPLDINHSTRVRIIVLVSEEQELSSPQESFRQGWQDVIQGNTIPVSQLWDGIDAD